MNDRRDCVNHVIHEKTKLTSSRRYGYFFFHTKQNQLKRNDYTKAENDVIDLLDIWVPDVVLHEFNARSDCYVNDSRPLLYQ